MTDKKPECRNCGKPVSGGHVFCSGHCYDKYHEKERNRPAKPGEKACRNCGTAIRMGVFCSGNCYDKYRDGGGKK